MQFTYYYNKKAPILNKLKSGRIIIVIHIILLFFFHPDFTVGFGIAPNQSSMTKTIKNESRTIPPVGNFTLPRRLPLFFLQGHHTTGFSDCQLIHLNYIINFLLTIPSISSI